jgi:GNAT superfamily N-acetyltransferase
MAVTYEWRGDFENAEVNVLHAKAFEAQVHPNEVRPWVDLVANHSLGWVVAREGSELVGFVNVLGDGFTHAWIQDVMVANSKRSRGIGTQLVEVVRRTCQEAGYEWLHVDFEEKLEKFYFQSCGFTSTAAGLLRLR